METFKNNSDKIILATLSVIFGLVVGYTVAPARPAAEDATNHGAMLDMKESQEMTVEHEKPHNDSAHIHVAGTMQNPTVAVEAFKDSMGGYNIKVTTTNFKWTPEKAGQGNEQVAGHAHVYVNGVKVARLYGQWLYISADKFKPGKNTIDVTLNGNNHMEWYSNDDKYQIKGTAEVVVE